jgi:nicotinamide riboside transporter PnuC
MTPDFMWLVTLASLIGTVANIKKKQWCFGVWLCTNSIWCVYDYMIGAQAQAALFFVYVLLAIYGLWEWRKA